jgi:hypothetical protein
MKVIDNEKGMALVLALVMLVLLTLLGAFALSTSSTELFIAGSFKNAQQAFYAGDAGIDYVQANTDIYTSIVPGTNNFWPVPGDGTSARDNNFNAMPLGQDVKVEYVNEAEYRPCPGSVSSSDSISYYFVVTSVGTGPANSRTDIEAQICRMRPM